MLCVQIKNYFLLGMKHLLHVLMTLLSTYVGVCMEEVNSDLVD